MNRYETRADDEAARAARGKRFRLELFLPLGGMIIVGLVSLLLGLIFHAPPERPDEPLDLPSVDDFERARMRALQPDAAPDAPPAMLPTPPDARLGE